MAECVLLKNGGGIKSDDLTATADKVFKGFKYLGNDTDDDIGEGTYVIPSISLELRYYKDDGYEVRNTVGNLSQLYKYLKVTSITDRYNVNPLAVFGRLPNGTNRVLSKNVQYNVADYTQIVLGGTNQYGADGTAYVLFYN